MGTGGERPGTVRTAVPGLGAEPAPSRPRAAGRRRAAPRMPVPRAPRGRAGPASCACHSLGGGGEAPSGRRRFLRERVGGAGPGGARAALCRPGYPWRPGEVGPPSREEAAEPGPGAGVPREAAMSTGEVERLSADLGGAAGDEEEEWLYGGTHTPDPRPPSRSPEPAWLCPAAPTGPGAVGRGVLRLTSPGRWARPASILRPFKGSSRPATPAALQSPPLGRPSAATSRAAPSSSTLWRLRGRLPRRIPAPRPSDPACRRLGRAGPRRVLPGPSHPGPGLPSHSPVPRRGPASRAEQARTL